MFNDEIVFENKENEKVYHIIHDYLQTATQEQLFYYVMRSNYDDNFFHLQWIASQKTTDLATIKAIYWNEGADYFMQFADDSQLSGWQKERFNFILWLEKRCIEGFYPNQNIYFDPFKSDGARPNEYDIERVRQAPNIMLEVSKGEIDVDVECEYSDYFAEYDDGLPIKIVEKIYRIYD